MLLAAIIDLYNHYYKRPSATQILHRQSVIEPQVACKQSIAPTNAVSAHESCSLLQPY